MKNLLVFAIVAVALTILNGCQKEEHVRQMEDEQPQAVVKNPSFVGLNDIVFSVEDNRLVFENEEEYQNCIDFLAQLGDENFPAFEKEIGFDSYRKLNKSNLDVDNLFATLINPEGIIQIDNYLFKVDFKDEKTLVYELFDDELALKSKSISKTKSYIVFNWDDDIFSILNENDNLKSISGRYCNSFQQPHTVNLIQGSLETNLRYRKYGLYYTLLARMDKSFNGGAVSMQIYVVEDIYWRNKKKDGTIVSGTQTSGGYGTKTLKLRFYSSGRRLKQWSVPNVECSWWDDASGTSTYGSHSKSGSCN